MVGFEDHAFVVESELEDGRMFFLLVGGEEGSGSGLEEDFSLPN